MVLFHSGAAAWIRTSPMIRPDIRGHCAAYAANNHVSLPAAGACPCQRNRQYGMAGQTRRVREIVRPDCKLHRALLRRLCAADCWRPSDHRNEDAAELL